MYVQHQYVLNYVSFISAEGSGSPPKPSLGGAGIHFCSPSWPLASCISLGTDLAEGHLLAKVITRESLHPMTGQCLDVKDWPPGLSSSCVCRASWFWAPCPR